MVTFKRHFLFFRNTLLSAYYLPIMCHMATRNYKLPFWNISVLLVGKKKVEYIESTTTFASTRRFTMQPPLSLISASLCFSSFCRPMCRDLQERVGMRKGGKKRWPAVQLYYAIKTIERLEWRRTDSFAINF